MLAATKHLSRQNTCLSLRSFVATKIILFEAAPANDRTELSYKDFPLVFPYDKTCVRCDKTFELLSRQKLYLRQLPPVIKLS